MLLQSKSKCSLSGAKEYMSKVAANRPLRMALFCTVIATGASACTTAPDTSATTSSVANVAGYPDFIARNKSLAQRNETIKAEPASFSGNPYLGRAPYICTPSGFGRTSSCFLRSSAL